MALTSDANELFQGFSKLSREERYQRLIQMGALSQEDVQYLQDGGIQNLSLGEKFIENAIGYFQLPMGVATNFCINDKYYALPMAVEETSIIAALSKTAKWINRHGKITTKVEGDCIIGQIQIAHVKNYDRLEEIIGCNESFLIEQVNEEVATNMTKRGGGVRSLELRKLTDSFGNIMAVIHVMMNTCDALGANILNQVLEYLKAPIENLSNEQVTMCILSNLNTKKMTTATIILEDIDPELAMRIESASLFAESDPYRAATNNKGVLNGIDPLLIATGNDWRAVEAGIHAYAALDGQYRSITQWRYENNRLIGNITAPLIVGIVGGVTGLHPTAQMALRMLEVQSADELSQIIAAAGLVQNLGAIRALCTEGIIQGHMKLHIDNLTLNSGANQEESPLLKNRLEQWLFVHKRVSLTQAKQLLAKIRQEKALP